MQTVIFKLIVCMATNLYSIHFLSIDGKDMTFGNFIGKKILVVNTAGKSKYFSQYASLEQLYQKYKDSLVIIAFPSNDFGHEANNDLTIKTALTGNFNIHYILAAKISSLNQGNSEIYKWLTNSAQNGVLTNAVPGDFTKFLIDGQGNIIGVFSGVIDPMDRMMQDAIVN